MPRLCPDLGGSPARPSAALLHVPLVQPGLGGPALCRSRGTPPVSGAGSSPPHPERGVQGQGHPSHQMSCPGPSAGLRPRCRAQAGPTRGRAANASSWPCGPGGSWRPRDGGDAARGRVSQRRGGPAPCRGPTPPDRGGRAPGRVTPETHLAAVPALRALVYFQGNLIHVFLIHFHLTRQNVALEKLFEMLVSYMCFFFLQTLAFL